MREKEILTAVPWGPDAPGLPACPGAPCAWREKRDTLQAALYTERSCHSESACHYSFVRYCASWRERVHVHVMEVAL